MPRFVPDALIIRIDKFLKETFYRTFTLKKRYSFVQNLDDNLKIVL